jgi:sulfur relay (sulfurtransferase) complex TusBCD TusD component (DsrE family)
MDKKVVCILFDAPYSTLFLAERLKKLNFIIANAKLVKIFFYLDATHQLNTGQYTINFDNIEEIILNLHHSHQDVEFYACSRCTAARGYLDLRRSDIENGSFITTKLAPFAQVVSIKELGEFMNNGYRVIQI